MKPPWSDFFQSDGKTVILPIDHGTAISTPGLENPRGLISDLWDAVDGFVVNLGMARAFRNELSGKGICLRADIYKPDLEESSVRVCGVDEADMVGATGMMHMLYPGNDHEAAIVQECSELIAECVEGEVLSIIEALPVGLGLPDEYTVEAVAFAARQAAELGADVVKTAVPLGNGKELAKVVEACFAPVIVLGGSAVEDDEGLLRMVFDAMKAGAKGIAIGRNVWQNPKPAKIAKQLAA
ncbi:MAG: hypothetical protein AAF191_19220, partial [Verrucomicrobiota bacterium]